MPAEFSNSDDQRTNQPLTQLQSICFDEPMRLKLGGQLPSVTCAYETFGQLNSDRSNAVLVCHAISGDSHVTRHHPDDQPGWWEQLVGPGRAIDTNRYFVICPNVLGGCRGSTGPESINPVTNRPFGQQFPIITVDDIVDVQTRLVEQLGIDQLVGVVGGSLGGHQAITWATRYPERIAACCAIATSPRLSSQALAFDVIGRNAIKTDPMFQDGQYYGNPQQPDIGLAIARMLGHITYLSADGMNEKFEVDRHNPRELDTLFENRFSVGSYLAYQGHKFVERFDANSYITLSMAMDLVDFGDSLEQRCASLAPSTCRWLVVGFSSDWLFPPQQSRQILQALNQLQKSATYAIVPSDAGHDGFLVESDIDRYCDLVAATLAPPTRLTSDTPPQRVDDQRILELIEAGESVLDLGCGSGNLLRALRAQGHHRLTGVEVDLDSVTEAARQGLIVQHADLDEGVLDFSDNSFDTVVLSATLQAVANIEDLLDEMLRVGSRCILSFANFAFRELRDMYAREGKSPKADGQYRYDWYDTPNRRFPSITDVHHLLQAKQAKVLRAIYMDTQSDVQISSDDDFNYKADTAILVIQR